MVVAEGLTALGDYLVQSGHLDEAEKQYQRAQELAAAMGDQRRQTTALNGLAEVGLRRGGVALQPALGLAERAVALARETNEPRHLSSACTTAGKLYSALAQPAPARTAFEDAIAAVEDARGRLSGGDAEALGFFEDKVEPYHQLAALLAREKQPAAALVVAEQAKARVLAEIVRSGQAYPGQQMTPADRASTERLAADVTALNRQISAAKAANPPAEPASLAGLQEGLRRARLARDVAASDFLVAHPELRKRESPRGDLLTGDAIRAALGDNRTALLEYVVADDQTLLLVVRAPAAPAPIDVQTFRLPLSRLALEARTQTFRRALANRSLDWETDARALAADILAPARAAWADAGRLIIIPDGPLWELPFQALVVEGEDPVRTLWETRPVSFAPSLSFLALARSAPQAEPLAGPARLLAFGNPATARTTAGSPLLDSEFVPLPDAERLVLGLADLYGRVHSKVFVGAAAHEDAFKRLAGEYDVLHLATHGWFNNEAPMYSRLLLSQVDLAPDEDGWLEAWEWLPLKLHARLVVLSACETGRGQINAGEGLLGMCWALFSAGCPAAVVSQWKVDSASTTDLMLGFHRRLLAGQEPADALREASLELAKNPRYEHPFYWAPFVLIGAGTSLRTAPPLTVH